MGNREQHQEGGSSVLGAGLRTTTYSANSLNQYANISHPQAFDVAGMRSSSSAAILIQTKRQRNYLWTPGGGRSGREPADGESLGFLASTGWLIGCAALLLVTAGWGIWRYRRG